MSQYAFVQDAAVVTIYGDLPSQYGEITGFNLLTDPELLVYGFYPYTFTSATYDPLTETLSGTVYTISDTAVTGTNAVVALSSDEIAANMAAYAAQLTSQLIGCLYACDWVMLSDSGLDSGQQTAYDTLRSSMSISVAAMTTYTETQMNTIVDLLPFALSDLNTRVKSFTSNITALQTALSAL